ncbi:MAG: DUF4174 domain-containing protein [Bacteroidetes bacterium]|nr:DUF4174 domain-containing protein [Bacteroidota bacterium]MBU1373380.1 DUF4174 domain-containing protein [Bacteroidota bacterium]MBU1485650.1 DUF4174 domain-containing protein [Bacteroidota bacterium]MBU1759428.1 DUF4174 domain-containing protein [Bacteroidota bacterium]MBU2266603.1 DUF4174 domain-containing protein [Bacteroidota bacterium]
MKLFSMLIIYFSINLSSYSYSQSNVYRKVILFYPKNKIDTVSKQVKILSKDLVGLLERQIKITSVSINTKDFEKSSFLKINPNLFTLVLVGKDGGQKFSSNTLISSNKLYGLIDQMPMRKQEMKGLR